MRMPAGGATVQSAQMRLRSLLFVPGDRPERMVKALSLGADALILDLEDAVVSTRKSDARKNVADFLIRSEGAVTRLVRINPLAGAVADADLEAVMSSRPDGLVLPKADGARSIHDLDRRLSILGKGFPPILPIATETPQALFRLAEYTEVASRLAGLTWGVEDLSAAIGASTAREADDRFTDLSLSPERSRCLARRRQTCRPSKRSFRHFRTSRR